MEREKPDRPARRKVVKSPPKLPKWSGLQQFFRDVWQELTKVNWPSREDVINWTMVTLAIILIVAIYVAVLDFLFSRFLHVLGVI